MLAEMAIDPADWRAEDASGLARNDMVTPRSVVQLLRTMGTDPWRELWMPLLPVGGQDGTLSDRLCCMRADARIQAKTGTLSRAVALSGYADSASNGRLAFSILVNNFAAPAGDVRRWVDSIATSLVE
jgi:D-alanyl-D-alanine carboxypeptidase/D-alanyl-D-alanine-endopeptidase (penicillin-binding protein 4)